MSTYEVGPGKPYSTIQSAIDAIVAALGHTAFTETQKVLVYTDTYNENPATAGVLMPSDTYPLVIEAAYGNTATVTDVFSIHTKGTIVNGFNMVTPVAEGFIVDYIGGDSSGKIILRNNTITAGGFGIKFERNQVSGTEVICYNNVIYNSIVGFAMDKLAAAATFKIYNNTIYCFEDTSACGLFFPSDSMIGFGLGTVDFKNNIIYADGYSIDLGGDKACVLFSDDLGIGSSTLNNNCYYFTNGAKAAYDLWNYVYIDTLVDWQSKYSQDLVSIDTDPLFIDTLTYDFHLLPESPCKYIGANLSSYFITDKDGLTRTLPYDLGAYKYVSTLPDKRIVYLDRPLLLERS